MRPAKLYPSLRRVLLSPGLGLEQLEQRLLFSKVTASGRPLGVDVSHFQGTINWTTLAGQKDFAIIKGTGSDQGNYLDSTFTTNANNARSAGIIFGTYHFADPTSATSASAQADYMIAHSGIAMENGNLPPMLDLEKGSTDPTTISNWANAFCYRLYARLGVKPVIYSSSGTYASYVNASVYNTWKLVDANYGSSDGVFTDSSSTVDTGNPSSTGNYPTWTIWQYNSVGHVPGIGDGTTTNVDSDVFHGTLAQLQAMEIGQQAIVQNGSTYIASGGGTDDSGNAIVQNYGTVGFNSTSPTMTFTIENEGAPTLTNLGSLTVPNGYSIVSGLTQSSLASLGTETFTVKMNTTTAGTFGGNITFTTGDSFTPTFSIPITGKVLTAPQVAVKNGATTITNGQTSPVNFGSVLVNSTGPSITFTVSNAGGTALTTSGLSVPGGYTVTDTLAASIAAGGSDTFTLQLNTGTAGTFGGNVSFMNNVSGKSPFSFAITGTVNDATPNAPSNLNFTTYTNNSVTVAWTDNSSNETAFLIERKTGAGGTYAQVGSVAANVTSWTDSAANDPSNVPASGTLYFYRVRAQNNTAFSTYAPEQSITTLADVPTNLMATDGTLQDRVTISWSAAQGAASYQVYRASSAAGTQQAIGSPVTTTTEDDLSATAGTTYYYWVVALNSAGVPSAEAGPDSGFATGVPPTLVGGSFDDDRMPMTVSFQFSEPIQPLTASNLVVTNLDGGAAPTVSGYSNMNNIGTFTLNGDLADAHFRATLDGVQDMVGNSLSGDNALDFSFLTADANGDGTVDASDFVILASNFGMTGSLKFSQGDFNYDGVENALDYNALAARFGESMLPAGASLASDPGPSQPLALQASPSVSLFSSQAIQSTKDLLAPVQDPITL